jgi:hypothetical protein
MRTNGCVWRQGMVPPSRKHNVSTAVGPFAGRAAQTPQVPRETPGTPEDRATLGCAWRRSDDTSCKEIVLASASMEVARDAAERGDWPMAEQALLDVQERSARLLRELGLQKESVEPPNQPPSPGGSPAPEG